MDPFLIIEKYYEKGSQAYEILIEHSKKVAEKSMLAAKRAQREEPVDEDFLYEAAMLHDIGIIGTNAPDIGCFGTEHYIWHGVLGKRMLEKEGFLKHALVCERHTGTGLSKEEIITRNLPIPQRDMLPISIEEEIICYADKFFSKNPNELHVEKSPEKIAQQLKKFGDFHVLRFKKWHERFSN